MLCLRVSPSQDAPLGLPVHVDPVEPETHTGLVHPPHTEHLVACQSTALLQLAMLVGHDSPTAVNSQVGTSVTAALVLLFHQSGRGSHESYRLWLM